MVFLLKYKSHVDRKEGPNSPATITQTLKGLENQTRKDFEVIAVVVKYNPLFSQSISKSKIGGLNVYSTVPKFTHI